MACGGSAARAGDGVRAVLAESAEARARAPELIARAEEALRDADRADARGQAEAAADHATRARLFLEAAQVEVARLREEAERRELERRASDAIGNARRDEAARVEVANELARLASVRAAREEVERALARALEDEGRPGRRARTSTGTAQDVMRAAQVLRARAELWLGAAIALGAPESALATARALVHEAGAAREPDLALSLADRAEAAALRSLGAARAEASADEARAFTEAAQAEGFQVVSLPHGLAIELAAAFRGTALAPGLRARLPRLAALLSAHPRGPVRIEVEPSGLRRGQALREALAGAGVDASRITVEALPAPLASGQDRARVVLLAL